MPTYLDSLPEELKDMIWRQVHQCYMVDLKIDVEMHYMYKCNCLCGSVLIPAMLCKKDRRILESPHATHASRARVLSRRSNRFFCRI